VPSHRVIEDWMGEEVETLEDLLRPGLRAVCVGINPSPVSVNAGHYYQGRAGQPFFARLREAGVLPDAARGHEDDAAFDAGIGFTDIIKRASANAKGLPASEHTHGRELLLAKLDTYRPQFVIFTFKKTAQVVFGAFDGNGFVPGLRLAASEVFVMPGTYESATTVATTMRALAERFVGPAVSR
jgi:TDG/mug DNA glycosylase family protein